MTGRSDYIGLGGIPAEADALGLVDEPDEPRMKDCPTCEGVGWLENRKDEDCPRCQGLGEVEVA